MNPTGKKFISLFLVFSLMMLSVNLYAKKRRGAELIITRKSGNPIVGELIAVKEDSLLILTKWTERDVSIDIGDIEVIRVEKKTKALEGAGIGLLIGGGGGALLGSSNEENPGDMVLIGGLYGGALGLLIGALAGACVDADKTFQIEGMTDAEIQETLDKLRKKARVRDYK